MVCPILIWGSITGCDIVTRSGFSGKWKLVPYPKPLSCYDLTKAQGFGFTTYKEQLKRMGAALYGFLSCAGQAAAFCHHFFRFSARKLVVRFQASAASSAR